MTVTLRIANLYCGERRSKGLITQQLARWKKYLTEKKIIQRFNLEPISVTCELHGYRKRMVKSSEWEETEKKRKTKDDEIKELVKTINDFERLPEPENYQKQVTTNFRNMERSNKILFYTSSDTLVFTQIQIHTKNEMGREKSRICNKIINTGCGCCGAYGKTCREILDKNIPKCWTIIQQVDVTILATHFPCATCVQYIHNKHSNVTQLVLRVANVQYTDQYAADRLLELYKYGIRVHLQPIMVISELKIMYATPEQADEWKQERVRLDACVEHMVLRIKEIFEEQKMHSLQQQYGKLSLSN